MLGGTWASSRRHPRQSFVSLWLGIRLPQVDRRDAVDRRKLRRHDGERPRVRLQVGQSSLGVAFSGGSDRRCAGADDEHRLPPDGAGCLLRRDQQGVTRSNRVIDGKT